MECVDSRGTTFDRRDGQAYRPGLRVERSATLEDPSIDSIRRCRGPLTTEPAEAVPHGIHVVGPDGDAIIAMRVAIRCVTRVIYRLCQRSSQQAIVTVTLACWRAGTVDPVARIRESENGPVVRLVMDR